MAREDPTQHTLTEDEIRDLSLSTVGLGVAFTLLFFGGENLDEFLFSWRVIPAFLASTLLVAISFIPHEMAHRVTARSMNAYAEYVMWTPGVMLAVLSSFLGVVFAAPGGVRMYTRSGERYGLTVPDLELKMIGYVAIVGPLINISLAVLFAFMSVPITSLELYGVNLLVLGSRVNGYLAIFNLLPFYPMDGYKVLRWNSPVWIASMVMGILTFIII